MAEVAEVDLAPSVRPAPRIEALARADARMAQLAEDLVRVSLRGLRRMAAPDGFPHSMRRRGDGSLERAGYSPRYEAIVLLGLRWLDEATQREVLGGPSASERCETLAARGGRPDDPGDAALIAWAVAELAPSALPEALARARELLAEERGDASFTVTRAWWLSALTAARPAVDVADEAGRVASRLLAVRGDGVLFPHRMGPDARGGLRAHVGCFADQVYPIQALARHHRASGDAAALDASTRCAERIAELQGAAGQWWWHYDVRDGSVVEGYPVYSVHQDAMGPMCLLDLAESGGPRLATAIRRSLGWMQQAEEVGHSLVVPDEGIIWRKVGRTDPVKLVRSARAVTTGLRPGATLRALDVLFPPRRVDHECRPYHLGWVLDTWLART